jgi:hypothetical protein
MSRNWKLVLSTLVGIVLPWIPVGFWLPGMFGAAIFFREGIHSDHPDFYLVLAQTINFCFWGDVLFVDAIFFERNSLKAQWLNLVFKCAQPFSLGHLL